MIYTCPCGWRGIPTYSGERGPIKGYYPPGAPLYEGDGVALSDCPSCHQPTAEPE